MKRKLIIIPGLGGHPEFHDYLIREMDLLPNTQVVANSHLGFFGEISEDLQDHIDYWSEIIHENTTQKDQIVDIIAISFGSLLVSRMTLDTLDRCRNIVCISPPIIPSVIAKFYKLFWDHFPRLIASILGRIIFLWSDISVEDRAHLISKRKRLYNSYSDARRRLCSRIAVACNSTRTPPAMELFEKKRFTVIYGNNEVFYKLATRKNTLPLFGVGIESFLIFSGAHSSSINSCKPLVKIVSGFLKMNFKNEI